MKFLINENYFKSEGIGEEMCKILTKIRNEKVNPNKSTGIYSQTDFADIIGFSLKTIYRLESNISNDFIYKCVALEMVYGCSFYEVYQKAIARLNK